MSNKILVLDIEGCDTALASSPRGVAQWASAVQSCLLGGEVPPGMALSVDPASGTSDAGGLSLRTTDISALMADIATVPLTALSADVGSADTSIDLDSVSGLPSSGKVWVGKECISYLTIIGSTLTSCTRGSLGTYAQPHYSSDLVYEANPAIMGRRVELSWQEGRLPATGTAWTRWVGFLDGISWDNGAYSLHIISTSKLATDQKALSADFSRGKVTFDFPGSGDLYLDHDGDTPWSVYSSTRGYAHIIVGEEVIRIEQVIRPATSKTINSFSSPHRAFVSFVDGFREGQAVDITDNGGALKVEAATIIQIFDGTSGTSYIDLAGTSGYSWASGDKIVTSYTSLIPQARLSRGEFDSFEGEHEQGADAREARVLEGELIEQVLLPLLCSVDGTGTHGPAGGAYDILPPGWGAGIDESFIDLPGLLAVAQAGRSGHRRYVWTEAVQLTDLLAWASQTCNAAFFWTEAGKLTAKIREDLYPGTSTDHAIDSSTHKSSTVPGATVRMEKLYNVAEVRADRDPVSGESMHTLFVELDESSQRYGKRTIKVEDPGVLSGPSETALAISLQGWLRWRALPYPEVSVPVRLEAGRDHRPGDLVGMIMPHLPNMEGGKGLLGVWEILDVQPADAQGQVELRLLYRGQTPRTAHVAPSGIVDSFEAERNIIILDPRADTNLAPASAYGGSIPAHDSDGTEDVHWFRAGDRVTIWDKSSFGSTVQKHNATVLGVDPVGLSLTLDSLPGWLSAGDIVRLRDATNFAGASTQSERFEILLVAADSTAVPPVWAALQNPMVWGS